MTNTIVFHNKGTLDLRAITTFGLNAKPETDNPIGFFGTGLKYAIAVILRHGCRVRVFAGMDAYTFETADDKFRGTDITAIRMRREGSEESRDLPFTLDLGKTWELWMAYRELYCNAVDENGGVCDQHEDAHPVEGHTIIAVIGSAFAQVHAERRKFINEETPLAEANGVKIVPTPGVYLRGIRIADQIFQPQVFGYDFQTSIALTEDRTLKIGLDAEYRIAHAIAQVDDGNVIKSVMCAPDGTFEHQIGWSTVLASQAGPIFRKVLPGLATVHRDKLNPSARELAKKLTPEADPFKDTVELPPLYRGVFDKALAFLARRGVEIDGDAVKFVKSLGPHTLGAVHDDTIYLSGLVFQYGTKTVAGTLYEEHVHLTTGFGDFSRELQDHLLRTLIDAWETIDGTAL